MKKKLLSLLLALITLVNMFPAAILPAIAEEGFDAISAADMKVGALYQAVFKSDEETGWPDIYIYKDGNSGETYESTILKSALPATLTVKLEKAGDTYLYVAGEDWPAALSAHRYIDPYEIIITKCLENEAEEDSLIRGLVSLSCSRAEDGVLSLKRGEKAYVYANLNDEIKNLGKYRWQIKLPDGTWAQIGSYANYYLGISSALLANVAPSGKAAVRCVVLGNDEKYVSDELYVDIDMGIDPYALLSADNGKKADEPVFSTLLATSEAPSFLALTATEEESSTAAEPIEEPEDEPADEPVEGPAGEPVDEEPSEEETTAEETGHVTPNPITPSVNAFHIVINYVYKHINEAPNQNINGNMAANTFTVTLPTGGHYSGTISTPPEIGYLPYVKYEDRFYVTGYSANANIPTIDYDGEAYVLANSIEFIEQSSEVTVDVYFIPQEVSYTVRIYEQNLHDDEYYLAETKSYTGIANSRVSRELGLPRTGFELPTTEAQDGTISYGYDINTPIAEDGSTVIEIYYDRIYYLVEFDLNAGTDEAYGAPPSLLRYDHEVTLPNPTRPGYAFTGWTLTEVYLINSDESKEIITDPAITGVYDMRVAGSYITVNHNLKYTAGWNEQTTSYTVIYWLENADNDRFTLDSFKTVSNVKTGTVVSAKDDLSRSDKSAFTYNATLSDHNVVVKGDGTTAINVYYLRNYYTLTFKGSGSECMYEHTHDESCPTGSCSLEPHVHSEACGNRTLRCKLEEHVHTDECLVCTIPEHKVHTEACLTCEKTEHETHTYSCYPNTSNSTSGSTSVSGNKVNGTVGRSGSWWSYTYWVYVDGTWYRYNGNNGSSLYSSGTPLDTTCHIHTDACYPNNLHIHSEAAGCYKNVAHRHIASCYSYDECEKIEHTHGGDCVRTCQIPVHTHTTNCTNTSKDKEFLKVSYKYGADISSVWRQIWTVFNSGERWKPSTYYSQVLVYVPFMPPASITFTKDTSKNDTYIINYYLEALYKEGYEYDNKFFDLNNTVSANYNYLTRVEDFFDIVGFTQYASNPTFGSNGQLDINGGGEVSLYYTRNVYDLQFVSNGLPLSSYTRQLMYQMPITEEYGIAYEDIPYPTNIEPGAVQFAGWYTSPNCADGTEFLFDGSTPMPLGGLVLYAKWEDCHYTANVYFEPEMITPLGTSQTVVFDSFILEPDYKEKQMSDPNYKQLLWAGWYYKDENGNEVRFDFNTMTVKQDLEIYAKWTSNVPVNYEIHYVYYDKAEDKYIPVAAPTKASSVAGKSKYFIAPVGDKLYSQYSKGYYPELRSHTMVMSLTEENKYYFIYTTSEEITYTVTHTFHHEDFTPILGTDHLHEVFSHIISGEEARSSAAQVVVSFREGITKDIIAIAAQDQINQLNPVSRADKTLTEAEKETLWNLVTSLSPDYYEQKITLTTTEENNATFYWEEASESATYQIIYYKQSIDGNEYEFYKSIQGKATINSTIIAKLLEDSDSSGFTYNEQKSDPLEGKVKLSNVNGELSEGLVIRIYYDRNRYSYTVNHVDQQSRQVLRTTTGTAPYEATIWAVDEAVDIEGYTLSSATNNSIKISKENPPLICFYTGLEVQYRYQIIGSTGATFVKYTAESSVGQSPDANVLTVLDGFYLNAWYVSVGNGEKTPINPDWISETADGKYVVDITTLAPVEWAGKVIYIFAEVLPTTRRFTSVCTVSSSEPQAFIINVKGANEQNKNVNVTFVLYDNDYVDVAMLPFGDYTATVLDWSWRFAPPTASFNGVMFTPTQNEFSFSLNSVGDVTFNFTAFDNERWIDDEHTDSFSFGAEISPADEEL